MAGWPVAGWLASWLAGWPSSWLGGWLVGALGRPEAERTRVGYASRLGLGPWGKDYRMGEAGNRHSLPAARRTAAERTAATAERTAAEKTAATADCC